jgi:hypothetical protein
MGRRTFFLDSKRVDLDTIPGSSVIRIRISGETDAYAYVPGNLYYHKFNDLNRDPVDLPLSPAELEILAAFLADYDTDRRS